MTSEVAVLQVYFDSKLRGSFPVSLISGLRDFQGMRGIMKTAPPHPRDLTYLSKPSDCRLFKVYTGYGNDEVSTTYVSI